MLEKMWNKGNTEVKTVTNRSPIRKMKSPYKKVSAIDKSLNKSSLCLK